MRLLRALARGTAVAAVVAAALACHRRQGSLGEAASDGRADTLVVHPDEVLYRGQRLSLRAPLADWVRVLGKPERSVDRAGGLRIWDTLGLVAQLDWHHREDEPRVNSLWIAMAPASYDFWPAAVFGGNVVVDVLVRDELPPIGRYRFHANMAVSDIPEASVRGRSARLNPLAHYRLTADDRLALLFVMHEEDYW